MKPQVCDAVIEVTRRCNMQCEHCLRGPAQKMNQTKENLDKFFSSVGYISSLCFTGGEPSLVPGLIDYARESAIRYGVDVGNFFIVTNGKLIKEEFALACLKWWSYCTENEVSSVELSQDDFHDDGRDLDYRLLKGLSFFRKREHSDSRYIIAEGRAKDWGKRKVEKETFEVTEEENGGFSVREGNIYLNCKGELIGGCDWSYRNQTRNKICNVGELSLEAFENFGGAQVNYLE